MTDRLMGIEVMMPVTGGELIHAKDGRIYLRKSDGTLEDWRNAR